MCTYFFSCTDPVTNNEADGGDTSESADAGNRLDSDNLSTSTDDVDELEDGISVPLAVVLGVLSAAVLGLILFLVVEQLILFL